MDNPTHTETSNIQRHEIVNDPRFCAMEQFYAAQIRAATKVMAKVLSDEMGPKAREVFLERIMRKPVRPLPSDGEVVTPDQALACLSPLQIEKLRKLRRGVKKLPQDLAVLDPPLLRSDGSRTKFGDDVLALANMTALIKESCKP